MDQPTPIPTPVNPEPALYIPPARPTPPITPPTPQLSLHPKKKSKAGAIIGLLLGIVVLLAGGTYAAARFGYITLPFPLPGTSNDVIAKSLDALYNTTASESTSEFSIKIATRDSTIPSLFTDTSTSTNNTDSGLGLGSPNLASVGAMMDAIPDNLSISGSTTSYSEQTSQVGKVDMTMRFDATAGESTYLLDAAVRVLEKNIYVKINALDGIPNVDARSVVGKWYTTDINEASGLLPVSTNTNSEQELKKTKDSVQQALTLAQKHQLFSTKKNFGNETIDGTKTRHTSHKLNPKKVVPFLEELVPIMKAAGQDVTGADETIAELKKAENQTILENISKAMTIDLWYDGGEKIMKKMATTMIIVPPKSSEKYKASQFVVRFSTTLKSSGKTKALEAPADSESMDTLMENLFTSRTPVDETDSLLGEARAKARDEQRKTDIRVQLLDALTTYYGDKGQYPVRLEDLSPTYIKELPTDPSTKGNYTYLYCDKNKFILSAVLEMTNQVYVTSSFTFDGTPNNTSISSGIASGTVNCEGGYSYTPDKTEPTTNISNPTNTNTSISAPVDDDTDGDGVQDTTEVLCGTKVESKDSDSDGYDDLTEIQNGYNPNGTGKATNEICKTYLDLQL